MASPTLRADVARAFWLDHFVPGNQMFSREAVRDLYERLVPPILHTTDAVWMREGSRAVGAQTFWVGDTPVVGPLAQAQATGRIEATIGFTGTA